MVFAAIAMALTVLVVGVVFQMITGDFEGDEAQMAWMFSEYGGVLAAVAWMAAVTILKSAKKARIGHHNPPIAAHLRASLPP